MVVDDPLQCEIPLYYRHKSCFSSSVKKNHSYTHLDATSWYFVGEFVLVNNKDSWNTVHLMLKQQSINLIYKGLKTKIRQTNKNHFVVNVIYLKVHFLSQYLVLSDRTTQWWLSFLLIRLTTILWLIQLQLLIMLEAVYFPSKWCLFEPIFFYGFWCLFICSFVVFQILSVTNFWIDLSFYSFEEKIHRASPSAFLVEWCFLNTERLLNSCICFPGMKTYISRRFSKML